MKNNFRWTTAVVCTLLSILGFLGPIMIFGVTLLSCANTTPCGLALTQAFYLLALSAVAWIIYFRMIAAWIDDIALDYRWPLIGSIAGYLAINFGGILDEMAFPAFVIFVLPAVFLASWVCIYHIWKKTNQGNRQPPQAD